MLFFSIVLVLSQLTGYTQCKDTNGRQFSENRNNEKKTHLHTNTLQTEKKEQ